MTRVALVLVVTLAACGDDAPPPRVTGNSPPATSDAGPPSPPPPPPIELEPLTAGTDEAALLEETGAISPWTAVLERGRLLARRGERGAVVGRVGPEVDGIRWLLDESDTARGLGIRVVTTTGGPFPATDGQRVLARGAWTTTPDRRWIFAAERLQELPPGKDTGSPGGVRFLPGELVRDGEAREGDRTFVVVAAPAKPGDGWTIADEKGAPASAVLLLPGEAAIYGGLDFLSPDERWSLAVGKRYAAPVTPIKTARKPPLPLLRASAAPVALQ